MTEKEILSAYLPGHSGIQEKLFSAWNERLSGYYKDSIRNMDNRQRDEFIFQKSLRLFFPFPCLLSNSFHLPDMDKGISLMRKFYEDDQNGISRKILIYGDRDADGVISSSILYNFFRPLFRHHSMKVFFPLQDDKYGVTEKVATRLAEEKSDLAIILDCGSGNAREISTLKNEKNHFIIMDHHTLPENPADYPDVDAFINSKRMDHIHPDSEPATSGLAFKFIRAFAYSFTSLYHQEIQVEWKNKYHIFFHGEWKESLETPRKEMKIHSLDQFWEAQAKKDRNISLLSSYLKKLGREELPLLYTVFENHSTANIRKKIQPFFACTAIGTVTDMMPVVDDNRILVSAGLAEMNRRGAPIPPGLEALLLRLKLRNFRVAESDIGFFIGPVLNAPGRLDTADIAFELLTERIPEKAAKKAYELESINKKRKEYSLYGIKIATTEANREEDENIVIIYHPDIHPGISGNVANQISQVYKKPAVIMVREVDGIRGSIRAYQNEDVYSLLEMNADLFIQFGGHKGAAGFSLDLARKEEMIARFRQTLATGKIIWKKTEEKKVIASLKDLDLFPSFWNDILVFSPYGIMNPHPEVEITAVRPVRISNIGEGEKHAKVFFTGIPDKSIEGIWFFHGGEAQKFHEKNNLAIVAEPHFKYFRERLTYQLKIKKVDIVTQTG